MDIHNLSIEKIINSNYNYASILLSEKINLCNNKVNFVKFWVPIYKVLNVVKSNCHRLHMVLNSVHSLISGIISYDNTNKMVKG